MIAHQAAEAEVLAVGDVDLHDQRLDQHLRALDVELLDHAGDRAEALLARLDHQRVGRRVGGDAITPSASSVIAERIAGRGLRRRRAAVAATCAAGARRRCCRAGAAGHRAAR